MVTVGEASARPAQIRSADSLHVFNELLADAVYIRNLGIASDPNAVINHTAEMLDEMPVQMRVDDCAWFVRRHFDFDLSGRDEPRSSQSAGSGAGRRLEESASSHIELCLLFAHISCAAKQLWHYRMGRHIGLPLRLILSVYFRPPA